MANNNLEIQEQCDLPEVSVIVITYNQKLSKLIKTLDSIVIQEGISFEIIICDDGSKVQYEKEIKDYFSSKNFRRYTLILHDHNEGTVSNYLSGLNVAKGEYSKLISPGDYFSEKGILANWIKYMKDNDAAWSFSDAYYYRCYNEKSCFIRKRAMPQILRPYIKLDKSRCAWNYLVIQEVANGSAILGKKNIQLDFCRNIQKRGIKYCEDYIYRLMMLYGIIGYYYPEPSVCYEYGTGVSTSEKRMWMMKISEDWDKFIHSLKDEKNLTDSQSQMVDALIICSNNNKFLKLFVRGKLIHWIKWYFCPRLTKIPSK